MAQEATYERGNWPAFIHIGERVTALLSEVHAGADFDEDLIGAFLGARGLVKSLCDPEYHEAMNKAQHAAGAYY